jgi:hypothetical protein
VASVRADCTALERLDAEIIAAWKEFDPDDLFPTALDELLAHREKHPARIAMRNSEVAAINAERKRQLAEEQAERRARFVENSQDYTPRVRPGLRSSYDPFVGLFRRDWRSSVWD